MAGNMERMLLDVNDSSSDDSDDEMIQTVTAGTAVPAAAAVAATVQPVQAPVNVPAPPPSAMSQSELSSRLKSLYSPASKAAQQQAQAPAPVSASSLSRSAPQQQQQQSRPNPSIPSMQQPKPQQVLQVQVNQERRDALPSSSSEAFRPLVPNRPPPQLAQQAQQRPISSDPFEPTPLSIMRERQQAKEAAQQASAPQQQQALQHPAMRTGTSSTVSNASSNATAQVSNTFTSKLELDNKAKLERDAKARKERFLMFTRVLMKYLEQKDPDMHARAKAVIRECADKNKNKERGYESVTASMQKRLKDMVGDAYWGRAEVHFNHFLKRKEKQDADKKQDASSSHQPQPQTAPAAPSKTQQQVQEEKQRQATIEAMQRENEKIRQLLLQREASTFQQMKAQQSKQVQQQPTGMTFKRLHYNTVGVCVAVRTYAKQSSALTAMLLTIREAATKVPQGKMSLYVHIVDTESTYKQDNFVSDSIHLAQMVHAREQSGHDVFFFHSLKDYKKTCKKDYGYEATQKIIDFLVKDDNCDWILTTNGDNLFGPALFKNTGVIDEKSVSMIGFDFATHHIREKRMYQRVPVRMEEAWVDLSSVLIKRKTLAECKSAKYFPSCRKVRFTQDWKVFNALITNCNATSRIVPEIHLLHN